MSPNSNKNQAAYPKDLPWSQKIDYLIILGISILLIAMAPLSAMVYDTARSLSAAHGISSLQSFAMQGPVLGGVIHFGPVWYYFLSIPLFFGFGVTGVTVWCKLWYAMTAVAAYRLGWALPRYSGSRRAFGLCLVGMLFTLGWHSMTSTIMAHTMYQWLCMLLSVLFLHKAVKQQKTIAYLASGIFYSLALHAHPSAIVLTPFYIYLAFAYGINKLRIKTALVFFVIGGCLPFVPYLIYQHIAEWPDFYSATAFVGNNLSVSDDSGLLSIMKSIFIKGPFYAAEQFSLIKPELYVTLMMLVFIAAIWMFCKKVNLSQILILLTLMLFMTFLLIKIKTVTHFYMTFSHWLVVSIIMAYAIGQIRYFAVATIMLVFVATSSQAMAVYKLYERSQLGYTEKPADLLADIDGTKDLKHYRYPYMNNLTRTKLARYICNLGYKQVQFGGAAALQIELSGGIEYLFTCDQQAPEIFLKGLSIEKTFIGLTETQTKAKGGCQGKQIVNVCIERPLSWQQSENVSLPIADPSIYPPRKRIENDGQPREREFNVNLKQDEVLLLSNPLIAWMPWEVFEYDQNLKIIYQDEVSIMFAATAPGVIATIKYRANNPDYIQISKLARP